MVSKMYSSLCCRKGWEGVKREARVSNQGSAKEAREEEAMRGKVHLRKKEGIVGRMEMRTKQEKVVGLGVVLKRERKGIKALDPAGTINND